MPRFHAPKEALRTARDESEIKRILSNALAAVLPEEIEVLPAECARALAMAPSDVHAAAVTLLQQDLKHRDNNSGELLRQLAELHATASTRLKQIHLRKVAAR